MGPVSPRIIRTILRDYWILQFPFMLLFAFGLAACNACVTFTSNPSIGTIGIVSSDPRTACTLTKMNAAVHPQLTVEPVCNSCATSGRVRHIFLAIRGIDLNSNASASDDSPDWQELLPESSAEEPLQVDLMESAIGPANSKPLREAVQIPAGVYREMRLRVTPDQSVADEWLPAGNPCGKGTFNCIAMADGSAHPLQLDAGAPELRITSDTMDGASLLFPPDTRSDLIIELKLVWKLSSSGDTGVRLLPTLAGSAKVRRVKFDELGTPEDGVVNDSHSR